MANYVFLPRSDACRRNSEWIFRALHRLVEDDFSVLEIGSGTAEHAVFFKSQLPELRWQCSDIAENLPSIRDRIQLEGQGRFPDPIELDVLQERWPSGPYDAIFTSNTLHIMPWGHTLVMLERVSEVLRMHGQLIIYGPFSDGGEHTAPSNEIFDQSLKARDSRMGVRDAVELTAEAAARALRAEADLPLPANNRILVYRKAGSVAR